MKEVTLTHPALGDRVFAEDHARKLMSLINNGGWEYKKPSVGVKAPRFSKEKDAATNAFADKGETSIPEEEGDN